MVLLAVRGVVLAVLGCGLVRGDVRFEEKFEDGWKQRWEPPSQHWLSGVLGGRGDERFDHRFETVAGGGLKTIGKPDFFKLAATVPEFSPSTHIEFSFTAQHTQVLDCGGTFLKLLPAGATANDLDDHDAEELVLFGADTCGRPGDPSKLMLKVWANGAHHTLRAEATAPNDGTPHTYTLVVNVNSGIFTAAIDGVVAASGTIPNDFDVAEGQNVTTSTPPIDWTIGAVALDVFQVTPGTIFGNIRVADGAEAAKTATTLDTAQRRPAASAATTTGEQPASELVLGSLTDSVRVALAFMGRLTSRSAVQDESVDLMALSVAASGFAGVEVEPKDLLALCCPACSSTTVAASLVTLDQCRDGAVAALVVIATGEASPIKGDGDGTIEEKELRSALEATGKYPASIARLIAEMASHGMREGDEDGDSSSGSFYGASKTVPEIPLEPESLDADAELHVSSNRRVTIDAVTDPRRNAKAARDSLLDAARRVYRGLVDVHGAGGANLLAQESWYVGQQRGQLGKLLSPAALNLGFCSTASPKTSAMHLYTAVAAGLVKIVSTSGSFSSPHSSLRLSLRVVPGSPPTSLWIPAGTVFEQRKWGSQNWAVAREWTCDSIKAGCPAVKVLCMDRHLSPRFDDVRITPFYVGRDSSARDKLLNDQSSIWNHFGSGGYTDVRTPLHDAVEERSLTAFKAALADGYDPSANGPKGYSPLAMSIKSGLFEFVKTIIREGVPLDDSVSFGSPLRTLLRTANLEMIATYVTAAAAQGQRSFFRVSDAVSRLPSADMDNVSALMHTQQAIGWTDSARVARERLQYAPRPGRQSGSVAEALYSSVTLCDLREIIATDFSAADANTVSTYGFHPLHAAKSCPAAVRILIAHGADPNSMTNAIVRRSVLKDYVSSSSGYEWTTIPDLIDGGADATEPGLLANAIDGNKSDIAKLLISAGADPTTTMGYPRVPVYERLGLSREEALALKGSRLAKTSARKNPSGSALKSPGDDCSTDRQCKTGVCGDGTCASQAGSQPGCIRWFHDGDCAQCGTAFRMGLGFKCEPKDSTQETAVLTGLGGGEACTESLQCASRLCVKTLTGSKRCASAKGARPGCKTWFSDGDCLSCKVGYRIKSFECEASGVVGNRRPGEACRVGAECEHGVCGDSICASAKGAVEGCKSWYPLGDCMRCRPGYELRQYTCVALGSGPTIKTGDTVRMLRDPEIEISSGIRRGDQVTVVGRRSTNNYLRIRSRIGTTAYCDEQSVEKIGGAEQRAVVPTLTVGTEVTMRATPELTLGSPIRAGDRVRISEVLRHSSDGYMYRIKDSQGYGARCSDAVFDLSSVAQSGSSRSSTRGHLGAGKPCSSHGECMHGICGSSVRGKHCASEAGAAPGCVQWFSDGDCMECGSGYSRSGWRCVPSSASASSARKSAGASCTRDAECPHDLCGKVNGRSVGTCASVHGAKPGCIKWFPLGDCERCESGYKLDYNTWECISLTKPASSSRQASRLSEGDDCTRDSECPYNLCGKLPGRTIGTCASVHGAKPGCIAWFPLGDCESCRAGFKLDYRIWECVSTSRYGREEL